MSAKLLGSKELKRQLEKLRPKEQEKALRAAARKAFAPVVDKAKSLVPVDSGGLRESLKLGTERGARGSEVVVVVGLRVAGGTAGQKQATVAAAAFGESQTRQLPPARRWHFVELGTARQPAKPFARPALDQSTGQVVSDLKTEIDKAIRKVAKGK